MRTGALLIFDPIGQAVERDTGLKCDTTNYIDVVRVSGTEILRGITATSPSIPW